MALLLIFSFWLFPPIRRLLLSLSSISSFLEPSNSTSINLLFGLPRGLLTGSCNLSHRLFYSLSKPCPSALAGFMGRTPKTRVPSDVLVPDLIHVRHKPQHPYLCLLLAHVYREYIYKLEYKKIQFDRWLLLWFMSNYDLRVGEWVNIDVPIYLLPADPGRPTCAKTSSSLWI